MTWLIQPTKALCAETCQAQCCRVGSVWLSPREANRMALRHRTPLVLYPIAGGYRLNFSDHGGQCPMLQPDSTCRIYASRPVACHHYPEQPTPTCRVWPA